jgi:hypothetical protein
MSVRSAKCEIATVLERLAADTGDPAWLSAAAALRPRPKKKGRHEIDDTASLDEMLWLLENGKVDSIEQAGNQVAASLPDEQSFASARTRLARKFRQKFPSYKKRARIKSEDFAGAPRLTAGRKEPAC